MKQKAIILLERWYKALVIGNKRLVLLIFRETASINWELLPKEIEDEYNQFIDKSIQLIVFNQ